MPPPSTSPAPRAGAARRVPSGAAPTARSANSEPVASADTKQRLLDAAERLFGERGFEGTSMRAVTQAAGTSVSAANYHFGSKEELLQATLYRRVAPVNEARLVQLAALVEASAPGPPQLARVLDAFLRPALEFAPLSDGRPALHQVVVRLFSDPPERVASLKRTFFAEVSERFLEVFERCLPEVDPKVVALRFQLVVGSMVHVLAGHLATSPLAAARSFERRALCDELVAFALHGMLGGSREAAGGGHD